jgi:NAD(P)-dependent dehydrogenase (short-subunit alcohol dehydrogenase family)
MDRVSGKTALVTGGARSLGKAQCLLLADEGANVVVADLLVDEGKKTAEEIVEKGGRAEFFEHDVSKENDWKEAMRRTLEVFSKLDILVNNAGVGASNSVEDVTLNQWEWIIGINLTGVFLGTKYGIETMKNGGGGSIINISSIQGLVGDPIQAAYNASKGGVRLFTKSAALHCGKSGYNIRVNSVHPGYIWTPMVEEYSKSANFAKVYGKDGREALDRLHPIGHVGEPKDVAYAVLYLASDESKFVTGSELVVDGGYTAQ